MRAGTLWACDDVVYYCALPDQAAATLSAVLFGSALLFAYHCGQGQLWLASLQPPLIYSALVLLFLPMPLKILFPVRQCRLRCLIKITPPSLLSVSLHADGCSAASIITASAAIPVSACGSCTGAMHGWKHHIQMTQRIGTPRGLGPLLCHAHAP